MATNTNQQTPSTEQHQDLTRPPVGAPGGPPIPPTLTLTVDEYQRLRGVEQQMAEIQKAQSAALEAKEQERIKAMAEKGQIEEALKQQRESWEAKHAESLSRYNQLEQQIFAERKDNVLQSALHGRDFVGATPEQRDYMRATLIASLAPNFETVRDSSTGSLQVVDKVSRRPAAEVLKERLDSPILAGFFAATQRGGSGSDVSRNLANQQQTEVKPGSVEAVAAEWKQRQGQYPAFGLQPIRR